ncbi:MAG: hypothetical protein ACI89L_000644 [Phycisphaerales bacterium]|jgi:hypothetical protein
MTHRSTLKTARRALTIAALGAIPALLVGCGTSSHAGDEYAIRNNPTPALTTDSLNKQRQYNRWAYVNDSGIRAMREDIARALYIDRPSRLHFGPKVR